MKQTAINIQLIAINMKQTDSINQLTENRQIQLIAINMKQADSINRNKLVIDRLN